VEGLGTPLILRPFVAFFRFFRHTPASNPMRIFMRLRSKSALAVPILTALVFSAALFVSSACLITPAVRAAVAAPSDDEKAKVLERLNQSAGTFHSASADVEFDQIETDPVYDKDVQAGVAFYEHSSSGVKMAVHMTKHNNRPSAKVLTFVDGAVKLFEPGEDTVTTIAKAEKFQAYIVLGFGASGRDLEAKWNIAYLGSEMLSDGKAQVKTEKLELVPKDPELRKNLLKVAIWIDPDRAVSLKQIFTLSSTSSRVCLYSNFKMNQGVPSDAFKFKTDSKTAYRTQ
jgi:outer membrane lipoprotein-sorting protein